MNSFVEMLVTIVCSIFASSGIWAYLMKRMEKKDARTKIIIGVAHTLIVANAMSIIRRGDWITQDEYEDLNTYLWEPYKALGGNGSAERIMKEVEKLRIVSDDYVPKEKIQNEAK